MSVDAIAEKLASGQAVSDADLQLLAGTPDIVSLGMIADDVRRRRHGAATTFVRVAEIGVAAAAAGEADVPAAAGEVRISGPVADLAGAEAAVRVVATRAGRATVTGFSLPDLEVAAQAAGLGLRRALIQLRDAGLAAVSFAPIDDLGSGTASLAEAAAAGVPVTALVFEHDPGDPVRAVRVIQSLQPAAHGVRAVAPLARRAAPDPTTGYADVRLVALCRVLLDVEHIQVDWVRHGPKLAQVALTFGADDLDRVSPLDYSPEGRRRAPVEEVRRNIRAAALEPVERDGRFRPIAR